MFGPGYEQWARDLVRKRPRVGGLYLIALGILCFGMLYAIGRATGMYYFAFVPAFCVLFGAWMAIIGRNPNAPRPAPLWQRAGYLVALAASLLATVTAATWGPLLLR